MDHTVVTYKIHVLIILISIKFMQLLIISYYQVDKESNNVRRARIRSLLADAEDELDIHEKYDQVW